MEQIQSYSVFETGASREIRKKQRENREAYKNGQRRCKRCECRLAFDQPEDAKYCSPCQRFKDEESKGRRKYLRPALVKQFCPQGHDTFAVGRSSNGRCKTCVEEAKREDVARRAALARQAKAAKHPREELHALWGVKVETGLSWRKLAEELEVNRYALKRYGNEPKKGCEVSEAEKIAQGLSKVLGREVTLDDLKGSNGDKG